MILEYTFNDKQSIQPIVDFREKREKHNVNIEHKIAVSSVDICVVVNVRLCVMIATGTVSPQVKYVS